MMNAKALAKDWFNKWEKGDFLNLPLTDNFKHTSPFGTINGKEAYLDLVRKNQDKFLGHQFIFHDQIFEEDRVAVRYTTRQGTDHSLDVSEWIYIKNGLIVEIVSYYHIGEIREERKLT